MTSTTKKITVGTGRLLFIAAIVTIARGWPLVTIAPTKAIPLTVQWGVTDF